MSQAGDVNNLEPAYDKQHDVYKNCLALLDTANTMLGNLYSTATAGNKVDATGDIYGLTFLQWRKVVNTYKLRVLISLSKRADDNADLNIKTQFAAIISDPVKYPVMGSNSDNWLTVTQQLHFIRQTGRVIHLTITAKISARHFII